MYLAKVDIFGFKSFAQKTSLKFNEGMSCVIGPNGSGKSNIVDSIRWVLGEQKLTTLRTDRMENVIFNGTNSRKPLGMAEVSLTIHNNRNVLKSSFSEIVISRRLYRSGESSYLINKAPCRLKDITDLFMDTGMGANSYSVIELSMVENIISENASERRHLFEEAAGINKYKSRRKSALRKLDATRQDMSRISDLISEIQRTVNSLSRQVGKARRYLRFKDELKELEVELARYRFTHFMDEINPLQKQLEEISLIKEDTSHQITLEEALLEEYKREIIQFEELLQDSSKKLQAQDDKIYQIKEEEAVGQARLQALNESLRRNSLDITEFQKKSKNLEQNIKEYSLRETKLIDVVKNLELVHQQNESEYESVRSQTQGNKDLIQSLNDVYKQISDELMEIKEKIQEKDIRSRTANESIVQIESEIEENKVQQNNLKKEIIDITSQRKNFEEKRSGLEKYIKESEKNRDQILSDIEELNDNKQKAQAQKDSEESRLQLFQNMISKYEGHSQGTRYLMEHKSDFSGVIGPISDLLKVEDEYKIAVETALGETINYIVVDTLQTARQIIEKLKTDKSGRVTLLPVDLLNKINFSKDSKIWQDDRLLAHKIRCEEKYRSLFDILLGDVLLINSLDEAFKNNELSQNYRFVTPIGELVQHGHAISGGEISSQETSVIGRQQRVVQIEKNIKSLSAQIDKISNELQGSEEKKNKIIDDIDKLLNDRSAVDLKIREIDQQLSQKEYELASHQSIQESKYKQINDEKSFLKELEAERIEIQKSTSQKETNLKKHAEEIGRINKDYEDVTQNLESMTTRLHDHQVKLIEEQNQLTNVQSEIKRIKQEILDLDNQVQRRSTESEEIKQQLAQLETDKTTRGERQQLIWDERDQLESEKDKIQTNYHEIKDKIINLENQIKKYRKQHDTTLERSRQLELHIQENQMKAAAIKERIDEDYSLDISVGIASDHVNVEENEQNIETLKYKINQLGQVNPLAVAEYDKESERLEFYTKQYNDLEEAEKSLRKTINKINVTARKQFLETFNQIKINFERVFTSFFHNGEGTLRLEEDSDPLETNIDIMVRPKGKRVQTINLLSGGEKTLTAISLLFAIYLVKPSPFCILDEIDAPLDDVNIGRFTQALKDFSKETQFIVVTHNKRTMEAADTMYGVTMEEEGLSKLVSVKFN
jgi:chromosome segregation protein